MKMIITILALAFASNLTQAADQVIATVDFKKIYSEYWRTDQADKKLKAKEDEAKKKIQKHLDDQEKLRKKIQNMRQALKDPKLGAVERNRRERQVADRIKEFQEMDGVIRDFRNSTMKRLEMEMRKEIDSIRGEIKVVVAAMAKKAGYTLVLDKNTVVFTDGSADLTKGVIEQLNTNDPRKARAPAPSKAPKKK
jgi:Skp family chaperone for outer membrane proteins